MQPLSSVPSATPYAGDNKPAPAVGIVCEPHEYIGQKQVTTSIPPHLIKNLSPWASGKTFTLAYPNGLNKSNIDDALLQIKALIKDETGIPIEQQMLVLGGVDITTSDKHKTELIENNKITKLILLKIAPKMAPPVKTNNQ